MKSRAEAVAPVREPTLTDFPSIGDRENAFIQEWARAHPFNRYRNYPTVSRIRAVHALADAVSQSDAGVRLLWCRHGEKPIGLVRMMGLPWDSAVYERKMARITHICGELTVEALRRILAQTDFDHVALRVDASDVHTQRLVTRVGFFPADSILTYLYHPASDDPPKPADGRFRRSCNYRKYEPADRDRILRLTSRMYARNPGRFHADPALRDRASQRYVHWASKYLAGEADSIWVSEFRGRVVGFLAFRYDRVLYERFGIGCFGAGLGASMGGDYEGLLRHALINTKDISWQCAEFDAQVDNYPVHRIYQSLNLEYVRAEYTFHWHRG